MANWVRKWMLQLALIFLCALLAVGWVWHKDRLLRRARAAFERGEWYEATAYARMHLSSYPDNDEARKIAARSLGKHGLWTEVDTMYASLSSPGADDLAQWGDALVRLKRWFDAARVFEQLLVLKPDDPHAVQQLAVLRVKQGRELDGIALAQRLAAVPDRAATGYAMLATLHQQRDNLIGAIDCWKRVIELDPQSETLPRSIPPEKVRQDLATCMLKLGRWEEALPYLEFVEQFRPDDAQVLFLRGWAWLHQGEAEQALEHWERTLRMSPDSCDVLTKLGELKLQLGDVVEALELLERAVAIRPEDSQIHAALANGYRQRGDQELSRKHMARSKELRKLEERRTRSDLFLKLDPASVQGKLVKSAQLARDGKWQEAELWVREVLRENEENSTAQRLLQDIAARRVPTWLNAP